MARSSSVKVLDTYLRGLKRLADLADEVELLEQDVAAREVEALRRILSQLDPLLSQLARPISVREPWLDETEERHYAEQGLPVIRSFQEARGEDGRLTHDERTLAVFRDGRLVEICAQGSWREGPPVSDTSWRVLASTVELTPEFARTNLKPILAGILDTLKEALERGRANRQTLKQRIELLEEVDELLAYSEET